MSHLIIWPSEPELKTTGIINKFTEKIEFYKQLDGIELSDFFAEWKLLSYKEGHRLYYGKVYRIKNISPNHLILQVRSRGGNAYHYINCRYQKDLHKITFEILTPNSVAYFWIFWPLILFSTLAILSGGSTWELSISKTLLSLFYTCIMILIGALFLSLCLKSVKTDVKREMFKLTGLKPLNS